MFDKLLNHDSHLIFQEIGKYSFNINCVPKRVEIYMSFAIQQPRGKDDISVLSLVFIDSVHFLNNPLDNLAENLCENNFYHLSEQFNDNVIDLLIKKKFPYESCNSFEKFKKDF